MTDLLGALLAAAAATPVPVHVQNWPTPPPPDAVALETLKYAQWAFWATVIVWVITALGTGFAFVDYLLNIRQFRRPQLSLSFPDDSVDLHGKFIPYAHDGKNKNYYFTVLLQLTNEGKRAVTAAYVSVWIPADLFVTGDDQWKVMPYSLNSPVTPDYRHIETLVAVPVFINHPVSLPPFRMQSKAGAVDFTLYWQIFDEAGKYPESAPQKVLAGVAKPRQ